MRPVVTVEEMRAADAAALEHVDEATLIGRAGRAVALGAHRLMGGAYGRRVIVLAGKGNNGNDGRVAADLLARRGAHVQVLDAADSPVTLPPADLVIDAAYGTGFRGSYEAPALSASTPVLAVDIPSGVDGDTGSVTGRALRAARTVTFAALKPGLLQGEGPNRAGQVTVADIGVEIAAPTIVLVDDDDVAARLPRRGRDAHKWQSAVGVVAGSPGMVGAAVLSAHGASHAGAGMVRLLSPAAADSFPASGPWPTEAVRVPIGPHGWATAALAGLERCAVAVVGPGLGRDEPTRAEIRHLVARCPIPIVLDADGLAAFDDAAQLRTAVAQEGRAVVLTPHDGEYRALTGHAPGADRVDVARRLAATTGAVVLLKGSLTAVATPSAPAGEPSVWLAAAGSSVLATAGTGDVLSGVIGAFVARGLAPAVAATLAAHVHGRAARDGHAEGLVAPDLPALIADWLSSLFATPKPGG